MKRYLSGFFSMYLLAVLALSGFVLTGCAVDEVDEWVNDGGYTASVTLLVPVSETLSTRTTDEEYKAAENKINTLRILVFFQDKPVVNQLFDSEQLSGGSVTVEGVPVGTVKFYAVANERALGKDYSNMSDFEDNLVDVNGVKKALVLDIYRKHFPKRFTEQEIELYGLPMSWHSDVQVDFPGDTPQEIEVELERSVAKLNVIMNNSLSSPITITSMNFGKFFGDQLYLFRDTSLDIPDDTDYAEQEYSGVNIEIEGYGSKTLACYIYPSYAWTSAYEPSPYTIGFATTSARYDARPFIDEYGGSLNSIARNTQINIYATLSSESSLTVSFEVQGWSGPNTIDVPSFN